jgi:hypothetical protein
MREGRVISITVPIRTISGMNAREHWRGRARRVKKEREAAAWMLAGKKPPAVPCTVLMTRVGPTAGLDDDNLASSCKGLRDQIAQWLGIDDRSPLVTWRCAQRRAKDWAVVVTITPLVKVSPQAALELT